MVTHAPVREPTSGSASHDSVAARESATAAAPEPFGTAAGHESVEALIREARRRARRRRLTLGAVVTAVGMAVAGIAVTASFGGAPSDEPMPPADAPPAIGDLGLFAELRGRIVWASGRSLHAVDPADPASVVTVPLPDAVVTDLPPDSPVTVAGWSADGTRLALSSEHSGRNYVVDADGTVLPHRTYGGCCWFVSTPWLSPDGTTALEGADVDTLRTRDVRTDGVRTLRLQPQLGDPGTVGISPAAWSPDGSRVALLVSESDGTEFLPSIAVVDRTTGSARQVLRQGPGHIRQVSWSPDGSRLLVIAGPWSDSTELENLNPLVHPKETGVYLVPVDLPVPAMRLLPGPIARGHFVAATWSGDGDRIAAIDFTPTNRRLVVMDADGSGSRVLAELPSNELFTGLAWHPATTVSGAR